MLWLKLCNLHKDMITERSIDDDFIPPRITLAPDTTTLLPHLEERLDYLAIVHHVCQSVEYILEDKVLQVGLLSITPALATIPGSLRSEANCDHKFAWL